MLELEINGKTVEVPEGSTVMDAARQMGLFIPHFCWHRKLSIAANCRMCLVEVEKAPKPLPACATPATAGMKVKTHSPAAINAQKGVMEFLLINHPLDCPICDQGGECQLQDLAVGYGGSSSRYGEAKRVVSNKDLGPLISTDMTRCIHCTRCVRFGDEIAGIMELGMIGRGEHSEIISFVGRTVDSELSGNVIDLCPVGALTSKPFRYAARTWELVRRPSVSPHCGLGTNLTVQTKQNRVLRVLPRENEAINECWLGDKDRFSYEGLNSPDRLQRPLILRGSEWQEAGWEEALAAVVAGLERIRDEKGASEIGVLGSPHSTVEELFLLQRLARSLGSENVDFRLRRADFRADAVREGVPWLGLPISELAQLDRVLIVGSNLRKDHPLIAHRIRQAAKRGLRVCLINPLDDDQLIRIAARAIVAPDLIAATLTEVAGALQARGADPAANGSNNRGGAAVATIADILANGKSCAVLLGNIAEHHPHAASIHEAAQRVADLLGARLGFLGEAANSVGGYLAGATPGSDGLDAQAMLNASLAAYVTLNIDPQYDCHDGALALSALRRAQFVVALSAYRPPDGVPANVILPIVPFSEASGTYVSTEGRVQSVRAVVNPLGEARPGWKVLRVIGSMLGYDFPYSSSEDVRDAALGREPAAVAARLSNRLKSAVATGQIARASSGLRRIGDLPSYRADPIVRRAPALQRTRDGMFPGATMNGATMARYGLVDGQLGIVRQGDVDARVLVHLDDRLPAGCVRLPAAFAETAELGAPFGDVSVEAVPGEMRVGA